MSLSACVRLLLLTAVLLVGALIPLPSSAQAPTPVYGNGPIPEAQFKSWSLFLMCNPEWLLKKQEAALHKVFEAYLAFAMTTGRDHAAVWFVKPKPSKKSVLWGNPENIDVDRSVYYCQRFRLTSTEGPHILVTTTHPDRLMLDLSASLTQGDAFVLLALGGSEPDDVIRLLGILNNQVLSAQLSQVEIDKAQYWQLWVRILERGCRLFDNVKFTVSAKVFNIEKTGLCSS